MVVDCETFREAISARIDDEPEPLPAGQTDLHLEACDACRAWQARAIEITRATRIHEAIPTPDLAPGILEVAPALLPTRGWYPRLALGIVALAQLTLGLAQILGVETPTQHAGHSAGPELTGHLFNESTAWNLALGIGLAWAALRPRAAAGLLPVLGGFVLILLGFSTHDLITGAAPASRIVGHTLLVAALILLVVVHRQHRAPTPGHQHALPEPDATHASELASPTETDRPDEPRHPLRPVGRHHVA